LIKNKKKEKNAKKTVPAAPLSLFQINA